MIDARRNAHFRRRFNASGPLERVLILIVLAVAIGVTIGLLLPQVSSDVAKITGGYTATGSAADTLNALAVDDNQSSSGYDRDSFGFRTTDVDGNGCDVRDDVLARDLTDITYKYAGSCVVESGTLADPYTAQTIHFVRGRATSAKVQIDHVVALENAWQSGAHDWSTAKRHEFGNDPYNLLAVDGPANQEKVRLPPPTGYPPTPTTVATTWPARLASKTSTSSPSPPKKRTPCSPSSIPARARPCPQTNRGYRSGLLSIGACPSS